MGSHHLSQLGGSLFDSGSKASLEIGFSTAPSISFMRHTFYVLLHLTADDDMW